MAAYTLYLDQLPPLLKEWRKEHQVYVPAEVENGLYDFVPWREDVEIAWDYDLAYNNLKRHFMPPREDLFTFDRRTLAAAPVIDAPKRLILGVHTYDARAINQLDQLMESGSPDVNYMARRENVAVFVMEPQRVYETAFWSSLDHDHVEHGFDFHWHGFDLYWTRISPAAFYVQVGSPRGEEMLLAKGRLERATQAEREAAKQARIRVWSQARRNRLLFDWRELPRIMSRSWKSPIWSQKAAQCLWCGSCNLVCPTCYCFDVKDAVDDKLETGVRYREWDGCMLEGFAKVAGGHNFREKARQRYRHRYYRKGKYIFDKLGELGCVGCGRCVKACTARIANPKEVFNELWEASQHEI